MVNQRSGGGSFEDRRDWSKPVRCALPHPQDHDKLCLLPTRRGVVQGAGGPRELDLCPYHDRERLGAR